MIKTSGEQEEGMERGWGHVGGNTGEPAKGRLSEMVGRAKRASQWLLFADTQTKDRVLRAAQRSISSWMKEILVANERDMAASRSAGFPVPFLKRLEMTPKKLTAVAEGILGVASLPDPAGCELESWTRPNGLSIRKISAPFGIVGVVYESRPDVTADAAALCVKSGNAVMLRGGAESVETNLALVSAFREGLMAGGAPADCVQYVSDPDRTVLYAMLKARGDIDLLIPRGGADLIRTVVEESIVPVIETGVGNCHIYVHEDALVEQATAVIMNAKCQNPAVCNAVETVLVDSAIAWEYLPRLVGALHDAGVEVRGCEKTREIVPSVAAATELDWETEYLDLALAIKVVDGFDAAVSHISRYGTKHSEAIITENRDIAELFQRTVDAACVYVNSSTRFTDGFEFGFGAEIGISTQKLHARGPLGLRELCTYKYVVSGNGQVRG